MDDPNEFPTMPEPGGRGHAMEATASMIWTLLFLAYSSSTFLSEFSRGWEAVWTVFLVILPITLAGLPKVMERKPGAVTNLIIYVAYGLVPSFIQLMQHGDLTSVASELADLITVLIIWLPLEFNVLAAELSATGRVTAWGQLTAALNILNIFSILRPLPDVPKARELGYTFKLNAQDILTGTLFAALYTVTGMVLATVIRFARFTRPGRLKPDRAVPTVIGLYMISVTDELLFRGMMQNMLEQRLGSNSPIALGIAALAFGMTRLRKPKQGFTTPNLRYVAITAPLRLRTLEVIS
ncbi:CPBP intramembrane metalloprotease [Gracilaria domingensis]|nr:CPBP intramembrane metalloprotease [Gracilaria domingensis]